MMMIINILLEEEEDDDVKSFLLQGVKFCLSLFVRTTCRCVWLSMHERECVSSSLLLPLGCLVFSSWGYISIECRLGDYIMCRI